MTEESFYVVDLAAIDAAVRRWAAVLPDVHPYYAVKCNATTGILQAMADSGVFFDCASPAEIRQVLEVGADAAHILYANPCKRAADVRYAKAQGVQMTTVDTLAEIDKLAGTDMSALLRVYACDPMAKCCLSNKYGAHPEEWGALLCRMEERGVAMAGVSFHVGSGACTPSAFTSAIAAARQCIDLARAMGHSPTLVDIGGGFVSSTFDAIGATVREALATHFPPETECAFIAEPGRLFVEHCALFVTPIIGKRVKDGRVQYWIADGIYGSFNCLLYDHAVVPEPDLILGVSAKARSEAEASMPGPSAEAGAPGASDIFGATCDGLDKVVCGMRLPAAAVGDWWAFPSMGAYTIAGASGFNGIPFYDVPTFYVNEK